MAIEAGDLHGYWDSFRINSNSMEGSELFFEPGLGVYAWSRFGGTKQGSVFTWTLEAGRLTTLTVHQFASPFGSFEPLLQGSGMGLDLRQAPLSWTSLDIYGTRHRVLEIERICGAAGGLYDQHFEYRRPTCPDPLADQLRLARVGLDVRGAGSPLEQGIDEPA